MVCWTRNHFISLETKANGTTIVTKNPLSRTLLRLDIKENYSNGNYSGRAPRWRRCSSRALRARTRSICRTDIPPIFDSKLTLSPTANYSRSIILRTTTFLFRSLEFFAPVGHGNNDTLCLYHVTYSIPRL